MLTPDQPLVAPPEPFEKVAVREPVRLACWSPVAHATCEHKVPDVIEIYETPRAISMWGKKWSTSAECFDRSADRTGRRVGDPSFITGDQRVFLECARLEGRTDRGPTGS